MTAEWEALAKPALDVWRAREAERSQQAGPAQETSAIKAVEPSHAEKSPTAKNLHEVVETKLTPDKPNTQQTRY
jgi:hypothetical protein